MTASLSALHKPRSRRRETQKTSPERGCFQIQHKSLAVMWKRPKFVTGTPIEASDFQLLGIIGHSTVFA